MAWTWKQMQGVKVVLDEDGMVICHLPDVYSYEHKRSEQNAKAICAIQEIKKSLEIIAKGHARQCNVCGWAGDDSECKTSGVVCCPKCKSEYVTCEADFLANNALRAARGEE